MSIMKLILFVTLGVLASASLMNWGLHFDLGRAGKIAPFWPEYALTVGLILLLPLIGMCLGSKRTLSSSLAIAVSLVMIAAFVVSAQLGWQILNEVVWTTSGNVKLITLSGHEMAFWIYANLIANLLLFLVCFGFLETGQKSRMVWWVGLAWGLVHLFRTALSWVWPAGLIIALILVASLVIWLISSVFKRATAKG